MTALIVFTVIAIVALIAVLAIFLFWVGVLLSRVADNLDDANESVKKIVVDAKLIGPGVEHINRTGGVVASALPLLYGFAEQIVAKVSPNPERPAVAVPASGTRRSRMFHTVGYQPDGASAAASGSPMTLLAESPAGTEVADGPYGAGSHGPLADGGQPVGFPIKGNADSMLYHVPGSSFYDRTVAEVWFATPEDAGGAGFSLPPSQR
ncbi:MAG: hypothetical protein ACRDTD_15850, partial [Pseudonocardiaceae bacterium]